MGSCGMLRLRITIRMGFFVVSPTNQFVTEEEYAERCVKRTKAVVSYSRSDEFYGEILIGSLSAIPRWRYARVLEVKGRDPGCARTQEALQALLESTKEVISGENALCEFLIPGKSDALARLALYSSMMRTAFYISEKNEVVSSSITFLKLVSNCLRMSHTLYNH